MEIIKLFKEMNLHLINTSKFKTITICILIRRPLSRDEVTINSIIPGILRRGSEKYSTLSEINKKMESLYGGIFDAQIIKKGEEQIIQFYIEVLNNDEESLTSQALEFLKEVVLNPLVENNSFNKDYTEGEIENLRNNIESRINNKGEYAKLRCLEEMCKEEPFGIYGDGYISDLKEITPEKAYAQYKKILLTSPIEFIAIGDVDKGAITHEIKELFKIERNKVIRIEKPEIKYSEKEVQTYNETLDLNQGKLCIGIRSGVSPTSDDFYNLMITNELLGGGANSKLFVNVREKESLCYYINSFVYRTKGILFIQSGIDANNFDKTINLIKIEINKIIKNDISKEEFENAKKSLEKKLIVTKDSPQGLIDFHVSQYIIGDEDDLEHLIDKLNKVTLENVIKITSKLYMDTIYLLS